MLIRDPKPNSFIRMLKKYQDFYNSKPILGSAIHTGNQFWKEIAQKCNF